MICWDNDGIIYRDIDGYTLWYWHSQFAIAHVPVETVDLPIENGGSFHTYVSLPEGTYSIV